MTQPADLARIAALLGDPARAAMLLALMSGMALTAGELAREAGITPQTASGHLAQLREAGLVLTVSQGRHRYVRLAGPEVAAALEGLMGLGARQPKHRPGPRDAALRAARICYDHLAGPLAVRLHDAVMGAGLLAATPAGFAFTPQGAARFAAVGLDPAALTADRRTLCRLCLDWSERRPHLAGALGSALLRHTLDQGWLRRDQGRLLRLSPVGKAGLDGFIAGIETARAA
jgi:DNA-binding transcriptional ArsR family regulator